MGGPLLLGRVCASGRMEVILIKKKAGEVGECPGTPKGFPRSPKLAWAFLGRSGS